MPLIAPLNELSCGGSRLARTPTYFARQQHTAVEMLAKSLGEVHAATRTKVRTTTHKICGEFILPEVLGTPRALDHRVIEAVPEEQRPLFAAQTARPSAVEMYGVIAVVRDGVVRRQHLKAAGALHSAILLHRHGERHPTARASWGPPDALELPRREAADVDMELVEFGRRAVTGELDLELQLILRDRLAADRAGRPDPRSTPGPVGASIWHLASTDCFSGFCAQDRLVGHGGSPGSGGPPRGYLDTTIVSVIRQAGPKK
jgi:hypothetical protein